MPKAPKKTEQKPHELTEDERDNLVKLFDVLIQIDQEEKARIARLTKEPKGFAMLGEGRDCSLCGSTVWDKDNGWYDKWGFKCLNCQDAINKRKIPASLCRDKDHQKAIPDTDLSMKTGIHLQTIRKAIRNGKIIGRRIPNGPYMILRKDNPNLSKALAELAKPKTS